MNLRAATIDDFPDIVRMGRKFWDQTAYRDVVYCPDSIAQTCMTMLNQAMLLVVETDKVVGSVGGLLVPCYANMDVLIGSELFWWVEPEYRDSGAGKLLLTGIEQAAKARGVQYWSMMALEAVEPDKAAAVYQRFGYSPSERTYTKAL